MARSVKSLLKLKAEIDARWPNRDKSADGWIGDAAHASRHSDHNPEPDGTVDARDFTHDPAHGADMDIVYDTIVAKKDPRVSYLIWEGHITSGNAGPSPWVRRKYSGKNGHYHHLHISVLDKNQDDESTWHIYPGHQPEEDDLAQVPQKEWDDLQKDVADLRADILVIKTALIEKDDAKVKAITGRSTGGVMSGVFNTEAKVDKVIEQTKPKGTP